MSRGSQSITTHAHTHTRHTHAHTHTRTHPRTHPRTHTHTRHTRAPQAPLLTFAATGEHTAVNDVAWCPGERHFACPLALALALWPWPMPSGPCPGPLALAQARYLQGRAWPAWKSSHTLTPPPPARVPHTDNATIFAAITADAKLQIWDLSVSSIDPVVVLDTAADDVIAPHDAAADAVADASFLDPDDAYDGGGGYRHEGSMQSLSSAAAAGPSGAPAGARRPLGRSLSQVSAVRGGDAPVARLMKALSHSSAARSLTSLLFGEKSPTVVVGDSRGAVTVYRVLDPPTITHEGPLQQMARLKAAIRAQVRERRSGRLGQQSPTPRMLHFFSLCCRLSDPSSDFLSVFVVHPSVRPLLCGAVGDPGRPRGGQRRRRQ